MTFKEIETGCVGFWCDLSPTILIGRRASGRTDWKSCLFIGAFKMIMIFNEVSRCIGVFSPQLFGKMIVEYSTICQKL